MCMRMQGYRNKIDLLTDATVQRLGIQEPTGPRPLTLMEDFTR